jgi:polysaccharide deacetylase 2 family uncharacterized protein YibQ
MKALAVACGIVFWALMLGITWVALFSGSDDEGPVAVIQIEPAPVPQAIPQTQTPSGAIDFPPGFAVTGPSGQQGAPATPNLTPPVTTLTPSPDEIGVPDLPDSPGDGITPPAADTMPTEAPPAGMPPAAEVPPGDTPPGLEAPPADMPLPADTPPAADLPPASEPPPPLPDRRSDVPEEDQPGQAANHKESGSATLVEAPVPELVEESEYGPLPRVAADGRRPAEVYARPSSYASRTELGASAQVAILINGLGLPGAPSDDVLKGLPPPVSVAYAAYGRDLQDDVTEIRAAGHEVLLQIPLEPENYPKEDPGPHTLLTTLPANENIKRLQWLMSRYTGYVGVTNHMGAKFETTKDSLLPVLEELKKRGLIYFDDGTVPSSSAAQIASSLGLDYSSANVQLDSTSGGLIKALTELETMAREHGSAIGVAKAKSDTVKKIAEWAGKLESKGIVLVPVSAAVRSQRQS